MPTVERSEIVGIYRDNKLYCAKCFGENLSGTEFKDIISIDSLEGVDTEYFCDECGRNLMKC